MRALAIIAGSIAGLALAVCLSEVATRQTPLTDARLISDAHGALAQICVQYRRDFNESAIETLADLFNGLSDDVGILVIVRERPEFDFLKSELARRAVTRLDRLTAVTTGFPITPWARDRFGAMTSGGKTVIAVPPVRSRTPGPRGNDELVPEILAASVPGATCMALPFMFEGGDLLADGESAFLAANCLARNSPRDVDDRPGLLQQMKGALNRPIVVVGDTPEDVPDHHICMYLTPLGDRTLVVADPLLGLEVYRKSPAGNTVDTESDTSKFEPFLNVIRSMEQKSFRVIRIPLLLTQTPRVYVSYNNVVLERRDGEKRVYMPIYGIPSLDRAAAKVFEKEGWRVTPVRVAKLYGHTGSLRCQVGVIRKR